ncbi:unnamed protein product, partial [Didymodactylos carnosus]
ASGQADYIKKGINFAEIATKEDEQKNYRKASENYMSAAKWLLLAKKHGNMAPDTKLMLTKKTESYINRAEQIRKLLLSDNSKKKAVAEGGGGGNKKNGDDDDEVDPEKKKQLKSSIVSDTKVSFNDVVGLDKAKEALKDAVILPIKFPRLFPDNRKPWTGILLYGPCGTGKSYLAKAIATECKSTFISVSSADLLSQRFGESVESVRYIFELAREKQPAIVFIDEIDEYCSRRTDNLSESARRIQTEFLIQMQDIGNNNQGVLILAATNIPWGLDSAIRRQFKKRIYIPLPDQAARRSMFKLHLGPNAHHTLTEKDWTILSQKSENYSGADIAVVVKNPQPGGPDLWAACSPGDPQAIPLTLDEIKADELCEPPVTMRDMLVALSTKKATVGAADLRQHQILTEEYGHGSWLNLNGVILLCIETWIFVCVIAFLFSK